MSVVQPMKFDTGIENSDTWWLLMILDDKEGQVKWANDLLFGLLLYPI